MRADVVLNDTGKRMWFKRAWSVFFIILVMLVCGCSKIENNNKPNLEKQSTGAAGNKAVEKEPAQTIEEKSKDTVSYYNEKDSEVRPVIDYLKLSNSTYNSISSMLKTRKNISDIKWSNDKSQVAFGVYDKDAYVDEAFMYIWKAGAKEPVEVDAPKDRYCNFFWSPDDKYIIADAGTSVLRNGYIISVKQLKVVDQAAYVFSALWSSDSNSIVIGKRRGLKTTVDTELEGTVDVIEYDFINKKEKIIAKGSANSYCAPAEYDKTGRIIYTVSYFDNHKEEKYSYLKNGTDFSMSLKLTELYQKLSEKRSEELLAGLEPIDICKLYFHAEDEADYETMYALYYREDNYLLPALDKFINDIKSDSVGRLSSRKFLRSLRRDVELIETYTRENEANIVFTFKNMSPDENKRQFALLKSSNGIWKVRWLPMQ